MAKIKTPTSWQEVKKKIKNIQTEMIVIDIATVILGILMIAVPDRINELICQTMGILLCIWGILRIIRYFRLNPEDIFGSFSLVQGGAMLGFGIFLLTNSHFFVEFIGLILAIILIITAITKLQYAFDFLRLQSAGWWVHLMGAAIMATLGILALVKPFGIANIIMIFIGCGFVFSGIWDLVSIFHMSRTIKNNINGIKKKVQKQEQYVDVKVHDESEK